MNQDPITAHPIETIQLVALQSVSGHEMSRADFNNPDDAIAGLDDLRRFGHAGYVIARGRIVSVVRCVEDAEPTADDVEHRRLARSMKCLTDGARTV